jgi:hypothetical protein
MIENPSPTPWLTDAPARFRALGPAILRWWRPILAVVALCLAEVALASMNLHGFKTACQLFLVFLCLAYLVSLARGRLRDGLVATSSLVLGLTILDAVAVQSAKTSFPVVGKGFYAYWPEIGWGASGPGNYPARKSDPRTGFTIYDVSYTIDGSRLRKTKSAPDGTTVAFVGDSFTFGEGVNDDETTPQAFADLTGHRLRVLNLGFPGYGPNQVLRALEAGTFDAALGSRVRLIVFTTAPWHAERTSCKPTFTLRSPRYRLLADGIEHVGACSEGLSLGIREWIQNTSLYRTAIEPYQQRIDHDDVELYIRIVTATVELAKKKYGAATLIAYLPVGDDYLRQTGFTDASIVERFRNNNGASVIDQSLSKERAGGALIEIPGDGHPTAFAHAARAQSIKDYVAREMPNILTR